MRQVRGLFDMAYMLGITVREVMGMTVAEYDGWLEWSKIRAEENNSRNNRDR